MGDDAIVHDNMSAEGEGVIVGAGHCCRCRSTNVGKESKRRSVLAYGMKVCFVCRRIGAFVQCWSETFSRKDERGACESVPGEAEAVHIVEAVAERYLEMCRFLAGEM